MQRYGGVSSRMPKKCVRFSGNIPLAFWLRGQRHISGQFDLKSFGSNRERCLLHCWKQSFLEAEIVERSHALVEDGAVGRHEIALRNAVDAPVDCRLAVRIDADGVIRIAEFAEEAQRILLRSL